MTIEFVDPDAIDKDGDTAPPRPKPVPDAVTKNDATRPAKRLVEVDERLAEALARLEAQLEKIHQLNTRLFGSDKNNTDSNHGKGPGQHRGVVLAIDTRLDEFRELLARLESEIETIDTLA